MEWQKQQQTLEFNFKDIEVLEGKEYKPWFEELM